MRISVVIPVHNTERYVADAIDSVLAQSTPVHEIVVVDDGSTDRTAEILGAFGQRIIVLRQRQSGPGVALNTGITRATGDHLAFNDADDIWLPEKLQRQCAILSKQPQTDAVFCGVRQFDSPDWKSEPAQAAARPDNQPGLYRPAMLIRRDAFDRIGQFDRSLQVADFIDWYGRAMQQGLRAHMMSEVLVLRRIHATNTGRLRRDVQRSEDLLVLKRLLDSRRRAGFAPESDRTDC